MRLHKQIKRTVVEDSLVGIICDICKNETVEIYSINIASIDYDNIDLCPKCFKNKLIPWLKAQDVNVKKNKW